MRCMPYPCFRNNSQPQSEFFQSDCNAPRLKTISINFNRMNYQEYIEIRADKRFGRPCVKGTRISVYDVLNWMSNGMTKQEIMDDFDELTENMINACLAFAADKERRLKIVS